MNGVVVPVTITMRDGRTTLSPVCPDETVVVSSIMTNPVKTILLCYQKPPRFARQG